MMRQASLNAQLVTLYLKHLKLSQDAPSLEFLQKLQRTHIETIPHENIDGIYNFHSSFDISHLLHKFILEKRGGMCFELNYSFGWLLHQLGFAVEMQLSQVIAFEDEQENSLYPTHPVLIVHFGDAKYLADVGWSDSYRHPLALSAEPYCDDTGTYRVTPSSDSQLVMQKILSDGQWHDQFIFAKPTGALKEYTYPKKFLAAHAYTHVGVGYLFTNLFHFTEANADGHKAIWSDRLLIKRGEQKSNTAIGKEIGLALQDDFHAAHEVAKRCVKLRRSVSCLFSYRPIKDEEFIDRVTQLKLNKTAPF